ncbi:hypothetical protein Q9R32_03810 [Actinotalea sp. AC32]|nr:hypothetical protein [Actinotalea sp. AC32]
MDTVHLILLVVLLAVAVSSAVALPRTLRRDGYGHRPPPRGPVWCDTV